MRIVEGFVLRNIMGQDALVGEGINQVNFNKLITMNESAAYLWQSIGEKNFEISDLADLLVEKYGIDRERADMDAEKIATQWLEVGIVKE